MARQKWREWVENEENLVVLTAWARAGLTDEEISRQIGISRSTLAEWKKKFTQIREALSTGKEFADRLVENSLFKMTQGFFVKETKGLKVKNVEYDPETGKRLSEKENVVMVEERHYIEPDFKAVAFWLKNRKPDIWKEKVVENAVDEEGTGIVILTTEEARQLSEKVQDEQ